MEFFIIDRNGQQAGPFSFDQLVQKGISPETLVWKQGMADWTPAWKVEELKAVLEAIEANQSNQNAQKQEGVQQGFQQGANQQQDYQKAQQEAYQQGFQQGAAMHSNFQQQPKKKTSHFAMKMVIGLIIFILAIFAITNPSADAHKEKVRTEASKAVEKAVESTDNNFLLAGAPLCSQDDGWQHDGRSDEPAFRIPQLYRLLYGFCRVQRQAAHREFRYSRQRLYDECRRYGEGAGISR